MNATPIMQKAITDLLIRHDLASNAERPLGLSQPELILEIPGTKDQWPLSIKPCGKNLISVAHVLSGGLKDEFQVEVVFLVRGKKWFPLHGIGCLLGEVIPVVGCPLYDERTGVVIERATGVQEDLASRCEKWADQLMENDWLNKAVRVNS